MATLSQVAELAGVSPRTTQRLLKGKGFSFNRLVDQVRFNTALPLLHDPEVSILEVAMLLGCGSTEEFSRAFRRMTGFSPSGYRAGVRQRSAEASRRREGG